MNTNINFTVGLQGHINSKLRALYDAYDAYKATCKRPMGFEKWVKSGYPKVGN